MNDLNEYHIKLIKKGLCAAEEGKFVSHGGNEETHCQNDREEERFQPESSQSDEGCPSPEESPATEHEFAG